MTYWERRQRELNQALEKDEANLKKRLSSFYDAEYRKLEKEIAAYYSQYGENNVIAYRRLMESLPEEDKRLLLERMDDFAEKYPEYAHLLPVRESIYKLNRLEGLQQSILLQQLEIGAVNEEEIRKHLEKQAARNASAAAETMGFGKNFYAENSQLVRQIVNTAWCNGKNFSQRIWDNVEKLAGYLGTDLAQGFARGDSYERLVNQLRQRFGKVSRNDAYRLIYTEGTFVMNEARAASFEQDTEEYIFRVQYDAIRRNGWRDICDDLDGQTFLWSERRPGINFPPMHAWCHCTATPYVSDWNAWMDRYVQRHGGGQAEKVGNRISGERESSPRRATKGTYGVNWPKIQSPEYRESLEKLSDNPKVVDAIETRIRWALSNRDGLRTEELYAISLDTGEEVANLLGQQMNSGVQRTKTFTRKLDAADFAGKKILLIHNHPQGLPPSLGDINSLYRNRNVYGITAGHDGSVYYYSRPEKIIAEFDLSVAQRRYKEYTQVTGMEKALEDLSREYGFVFKKLSR